MKDLRIASKEKERERERKREKEKERAIERSFNQLERTSESEC